MKSIRSLFGGGGGGNAGMTQALALAQSIQQQAEMRNIQGRQLAEIAKTQGEADLEAANMRRPGLGRALLTYRGAMGRRSGSLGGD